jgi:hypothetical protein
VTILNELDNIALMRGPVLVSDRAASIGSAKPRDEFIEPLLRSFA